MPKRTRSSRLLYADVVAGRGPAKRPSSRRNLRARPRLPRRPRDGATVRADDRAGATSPRRADPDHPRAAEPPRPAFQVYGARAVPFYNYLQAALVVYEDVGSRRKGSCGWGSSSSCSTACWRCARPEPPRPRARRGHLRGVKAVEPRGLARRAREERQAPGRAGACASWPSASRRWGRWREHYKDTLCACDYANMVLAHNARRKKGAEGLTSARRSPPRRAAEQLPDPPGPRHDVLVLVEPLLFVPPRPR